MQEHKSRSCPDSCPTRNGEDAEGQGEGHIQRLMPIILAGRWLQRGWGQGSGLCLAWAVSGGLDQATLLGDNKNSTGSWATQVMWIEKGTRRLFVHLLFNRRIAWRGRPSSVSCSGKAAIFFWSDKDRWPCYKHFQLGFHNSFILYHILFLSDPSPIIGNACQ